MTGKLTAVALAAVIAVAVADGLLLVRGRIGAHDTVWDQYQLEDEERMRRIVSVLTTTGVLAVVLAGVAGRPASAERSGVEQHDPEQVVPDPIEARYQEQGPWTEVTVVELDDYTIVQPTGLGTNSRLDGSESGDTSYLHPIVTFGVGTWGHPSIYQPHLEHWALWGHVVIPFSTVAGHADSFAHLAGDETTEDFRCIPGDNLGWAPVAATDHDAVPSDVATVAFGSSLGEGLGGTAQTLCSAPTTQSGGTFGCGAGLSLATPASAAAGTYSATLTLTLA